VDGESQGLDAEGEGRVGGALRGRRGHRGHD
jgi:hypothetical protein